MTSKNIVLSSPSHKLKSISNENSNNLSVEQNMVKQPSKVEVLSYKDEKKIKMIDMLFDIMTES